MHITNGRLIARAVAVKLRKPKNRLNFPVEAYVALGSEYPPAPNASGLSLCAFSGGGVDQSRSEVLTGIIGARRV